MPVHPADRLVALAAPTESGPAPEQSLPMRLLAAGIPLTLLLDLAEQFGPPSRDILRAEHGDAEWLLADVLTPRPAAGRGRARRAG